MLRVFFHELCYWIVLLASLVPEGLLIFWLQHEKSALRWQYYALQKRLWHRYYIVMFHDVFQVSFESDRNSLFNKWRSWQIFQILNFLYFNISFSLMSIKVLMLFHIIRRCLRYTITRDTIKVCKSRILILCSIDKFVLFFVFS